MAQRLLPLKWAHVDVEAGSLSVETADTGERVEIPSFPRITEERIRAVGKAGDSEFHFPAVAWM